MEALSLDVPPRLPLFCGSSARKAAVSPFTGDCAAAFWGVINYFDARFVHGGLINYEIGLLQRPELMRREGRGAPRRVSIGTPLPAACEDLRQRIIDIRYIILL